MSGKGPFVGFGPGLGGGGGGGGVIPAGGSGQIVDVLALLPGDSPVFTVDTGELSVPILNVADPPGDMIMRSAGGYSKFTKGDNFIILSAGFLFPESFCMAQAPTNIFQNCPSINPGLMLAGGGSVSPVPNVGTKGLMLPLENYELSIGVLVDVWNWQIVPGNYYFRLNDFQMVCYWEGLDEANTKFPMVSMVGVPKVLDETAQHLTVFMKILHTLPLAMDITADFHWLMKDVTVS